MKRIIIPLVAIIMSCTQPATSTYEGTLTTKDTLITIQGNNTQYMKTEYRMEFIMQDGRVIEFKADESMMSSPSDSTYRIGVNKNKIVKIEQKQYK